MFHFTGTSDNFPVGLEGGAGSQFPRPVGRGSDSESSGVKKAVTPYQQTQKVQLKVHAHPITPHAPHPFQAKRLPPHLHTPLSY